MKKLFVLLVLSIALSSCSNSYRYFTQDLYDDFGWSDNELKRIQFYLSEDIVLFRRVGGENARITRGQIRVVDGREIEEVIIEKGTPGVFVQSPKDNRFAISFDANKRDYLMFGPNRKAQGRYVLLAKDWDKRVGEITYGGELYQTSSASAYAALMVDIKKAQKVKRKTKKVSGARVR